MRFFDSRSKQSFSLFWIFGSLVGLGFVFMGCCIIYAFINLTASEREGGMLATGIAILIMGLLLLAGVVYTLIKTAGPDDLSSKDNTD